MAQAILVQATSDQVTYIPFPSPDSHDWCWVVKKPAVASFERVPPIVPYHRCHKTVWTTRSGQTVLWGWTVLEASTLHCEAGQKKKKKKQKKKRRRSRRKQTRVPRRLTPSGLRPPPFNCGCFSGQGSQCIKWIWLQHSLAPRSYLRCNFLFSAVRFMQSGVSKTCENVREREFRSKPRNFLGGI